VTVMTTHQQAAQLDARRLSRILDSVPSEGLQDLTELAAHACGSPMAFTLFIEGEKQWIKSSYGLTPDQLDFAGKLCALVDLRAGLSVISDISSDPRFNNSPPVTGEPLLRFIAISPITLDSGHSIGALCIMDRSPRALTPGQEKALRTICQQVLTQLDLQELEQRYERFVTQGGVGVLEITTDGFAIYANPIMCSMLQVDSPEELVGIPVRTFLTPEGQAVLDSGQAKRQEGQPTSYEVELIGLKGQRRNVLIHCSPLYDSEGRTKSLVGVFTDITEQKRAEEERELVMNAASCILWNAVVTGQNDDYSWDMTIVNTAAAQDFLPIGAFEIANWAGKWHEGTLSEDRERTHQTVMDALRSGQKSYAQEYRQINSYGELRWLYETVRIEPEGPGRRRLSGVCTDVTDLKITQEAQKASEVRLNTIVETLGEGILITDLADVVLYANPRITEITGYACEEMLGRPAYEMLTPSEDLPALQERNRQRKEGRAEQYEVKLKRKDGTLFWTAINATPFRNPQGEIVGTLGAITDITERKKAEEELVRSHDLLTAVAESTTDAVFVKDLEGRYLLINEAGAMLVGKTVEEVLYRDDFSIFGSDAALEIMSADRAVIESGIPTSFETERTVGGITRTYHTTKAPLRDPKGNILGLVGISRDISDREKAEKALREEYRSAERLRKIGGLLAEELDKPKLVQIITDEATALIGAQFGSYFYTFHDKSALDGKGETFVLYTLSGAPREAFEQFPAPRATEIFGPTFRGEGVIRSDDITQDPRYGKNSPYSGMPEGHLPVRSYLAVPVQGRSGEVFGGLFFGHAEPGKFTERHESLVSEVALRAAIALDNSRLYEAAQEEIEVRKQIENALVQSERFARGTVDGLSSHIAILDEQGTILAVNEAWKMFALTNPPCEEARSGVGANYLEVCDRASGRYSEEAAGFADGIRSVLRGERDSFSVEYPCHSPNEKRWFVARVTRFAGEGPTRVVVAHDNITERKLAEEALRKSEERFRKLAESGMVGIGVADLDGRLLEANDGLLQIIAGSREELASGQLRWDKMSVPEFRAKEVHAIDELSEKGLFSPYERELARPDGSRVPVLIGGVALDRSRAICLVLDLTEQKRLEAQLRQAQKMESIGRLAGGIAHDFNNLLTAIMGYAELAEMELGEDHRAKIYLQHVGDASRRAAELTQQLLTFARKQIIEPRVIDLNSQIADVHRILQRLIGEDIELSSVTAAEPMIVKVDPTQMEQVLINLAINARDSMPGGGALRIETSRVAADNNTAFHDLGLPETTSPGDYVRLAVSDTGTGMTPEVQQHIFEPFFTTKAAGKGTGLGLATCYGIIQQSGGHINVRSVVNEGTTFEVYLPFAAEPLQFVPEEEQKMAIPGGTETILLIEDEEMVRDIGLHTLRAHGYTVLEATNGVEALQKVQGKLDGIDLVVTDVVMPQMGGQEVAQQLRALAPGLKVLFVSGYADGGLGTELEGQPDYGFLQKPFTPVSLALKVREILDRS
jgi:PAS domain S-box-containing protein